MKIFKLPDLGEGLPDAIIREWHVKPGDEVNVDQVVVSVETAKALVDVPSPFNGKIEKLFGQAGDTIETGQPLLGFEGEGLEETVKKDSGTVVGALESGEKIIQEPILGVAPTKTASQVKATPAVRQLAKQLGVDLSKISAKGDSITAEEVIQASKQAAHTGLGLQGKMETLSPMRRAMMLSMTQAHQKVAAVTVSDHADLYRWTTKQDVTLRLIRAIQNACESVPILNAFFDDQAVAYQLNEKINLGLAVDTEHGLYVPVLKDIQSQLDAALRQKIDSFKEQAKTKSIHQEDLHGATITLSNFGALAGRYANPMIIPPMVAIVGVGRSYEACIPENGKPAVHRLLPISITFDHRLVTGGETVRFLRVMIDQLEKG